MKICPIMARAALGRLHRCVMEAGHPGLCIGPDGCAITANEIPVELRSEVTRVWLSEPTYSSSW